MFRDADLHQDQEEEELTSNQNGDNGERKRFDDLVSQVNLTNISEILAQVKLIWESQNIREEKQITIFQSLYEHLAQSAKAEDVLDIAKKIKVDMANNEFSPLLLGHLNRFSYDLITKMYAKLVESSAAVDTALEISSQLSKAEEAKVISLEEGQRLALNICGQLAGTVSLENVQDLAAGIEQIEKNHFNSERIKWGLMNNLYRTLFKKADAANAQQIENEVLWAIQQDYLWTRDGEDILNQLRKL